MLECTGKKGKSVRDDGSHERRDFGRRLTHAARSGGAREILAFGQNGRATSLKQACVGIGPSYAIQGIWRCGPRHAGRPC